MSEVLGRSIADRKAVQAIVLVLKGQFDFLESDEELIGDGIPPGYKVVIQKRSDHELPVEVYHRPPGDKKDTWRFVCSLKLRAEIKVTSCWL